MPQQPQPSRWHLDPRGLPAGDELVGAGADLEPGTILAAYRAGVFPMGLGDEGSGPMGWWSPDPRGVLLPGDLRISRSLRRSQRRFTVTVDTAFDAVIGGCADPSRPRRWITPAIMTAYRRLHQLGWAHSIEVWHGDGNDLAGGLYGLNIGGLFAGESMFHRMPDASKVALAALVDLLGDGGGATDSPRWLLDVQWPTPHLRSLGVRDLERGQYLSLLERVLAQPSPAAFADTPDSASP